MPGYEYSDEENEPGNSPCSKRRKVHKEWKLEKSFSNETATEFVITNESTWSFSCKKYSSYW